MSTEYDLVNRLVVAARCAFTQARQQHPKDTFYYFALFTDEMGAYVLPTCNSEEALREAADRCAREFGRTEAEHTAVLRWSPADSPYHMLGMEYFSDLMELFRSHGDPWQSDDDCLDAEIDARVEAAFQALTILDKEGFFGQGVERERVIVTVFRYQQSSHSLLTNTSRLNPPSAVARMKRELDIPDPVGDFITLGSQGAYQITALAYAPSTKVLVACGSGGELVAWSFEEDRELFAKKHDTGYWEAVISADGHKLLVNDRKRLYRIEPSRGAQLELGIQNAWSVAISPNGEVIVTAYDDCIEASDAVTGQRLWRQGMSVSNLCFSSDGGMLAVVRNTPIDNIALLSARDGVVRHNLDSVCASQGTRRPIAWAPNSHNLAVADASGHITILYRQQDTFILGATLQLGAEGIPAPSVTDLTFSPDDSLLASTHADGSVHIWAPSRGRHLQQLRGVAESMDAVAFIDNRRVAAAGRDVDIGPPIYVWTIAGI
ncbi:quinon protein alcohol dehydrogenase-like superfamily [Aspergillus ambiguus]|uniref:quinon protein alcohol dehydrogenase-like superfamily n=1 Tax=Aspergillus ambiguus TaxID=176160 RepID=UPI003CCCA2CD